MRFRIFVGILIFALVGVLVQVGFNKTFAAQQFAFFSQATTHLPREISEIVHRALVDQTIVRLDRIKDTLSLKDHCSLKSVPKPKEPSDDRYSVEMYGPDKLTGFEKLDMAKHLQQLIGTSQEALLLERDRASLWQDGGASYSLIDYQLVQARINLAESVMQNSLGILGDQASLPAPELTRPFESPEIRLVMQSLYQETGYWFVPGGVTKSEIRKNAQLLSRIWTNWQTSRTFATLEGRDLKVVYIDSPTWIDPARMTINTDSDRQYILVSRNSTPQQIARQILAAPLVSSPVSLQRHQKIEKMHLLLTEIENQLAPSSSFHFGKRTGVACRTVPELSLDNCIEGLKTLHNRLDQIDLSMLPPIPFIEISDRNERKAYGYLFVRFDSKSMNLIQSE